MQVFPRETTDYISRRFYEYFHAIPLTLREARTLIEHEIGPSSRPGEGVVADPARPRVKSSGRQRPTDGEADAIYRRAETDAEWTEVFDELLRRLTDEPDADKFIRLVWQRRWGIEAVCRRLHIERTTYFERRRCILEMAATLAAVRDLLIF